MMGLVCLDEGHWERGERPIELRHDSRWFRASFVVMVVVVAADTTLILGNRRFYKIDLDFVPALLE